MPKRRETSPILRLPLGCLCAFLLSALVLLAGTQNATAQCAAGQVAITTSGASLPAYNPFAGTLITSVVVQVRNNSSNICQLAVSFPSSNVNQSSMSNGAGSFLNYKIENAANSKIVFYVGATPVAANDRVNINNLNPGATRSLTVDVITLTNQVVADGLYQDAAMQVHVFNRAGGTLTLIQTASFSVTQTVSKICRLNAPSVTSMNFSSAITNGRPNAGSVQSTTFSSVQCTAPTIVRLTGAALSPTLAIAARPNFDNFIGWRAVGTFGSASATLNATTTTSTSASSPTKNTTSGATTSGTIGVSINLLDSGRPVQAGSYSGILTVTIDPNL